MNTGNLLVLTAIFSLVLLALQRTERKRLWVTALVLLLPTAYLVYRWAIYRGQVEETLAAAGAAMVFNLLFWLIYGRRRPPASSDAIDVLGMED
jgi:branched-subunit amino acid ABC-type transport system permease component